MKNTNNKTTYLSFSAFIALGLGRWFLNEPDSYIIFYLGVIFIWAIILFLIKTKEK